MEGQSQLATAPEAEFLFLDAEGGAQTANAAAVSTMLVLPMPSAPDPAAAAPPAPAPPFEDQREGVSPGACSRDSLEDTAGINSIFDVMSGADSSEFSDEHGVHSETETPLPAANVVLDDYDPVYQMSSDDDSDDYDMIEAFGTAEEAVIQQQDVQPEFEAQSVVKGGGPKAKKGAGAPKPALKKGGQPKASGAAKLRGAAATGVGGEGPGMGGGTGPPESQDVLLEYMSQRQQLALAISQSLQTGHRQGARSLELQPLRLQTDSITGSNGSQTLSPRSKKRLLAAAVTAVHTKTSEGTLKDAGSPVDPRRTADTHSVHGERFGREALAIERASIARSDRQANPVDVWLQQVAVLWGKVVEGANQQEDCDDSDGAEDVVVTHLGANSAMTSKKLVSLIKTAALLPAHSKVAKALDELKVARLQWFLATAYHLLFVL
jgi:hypothetical protein